MPNTWEEVSEERYYDMLGAVPPALQIGWAFLLGEAETHRNGEPVFRAFDERGGKFWEASEPMTLAEFRNSMRAWRDGEG